MRAHFKNDRYTFLLAIFFFLDADCSCGSWSLGAQTKQTPIEMAAVGAVLNSVANTLKEGFQRKKDVSHDMMRKGSQLYNNFFNTSVL